MAEPPVLPGALQERLIAVVPLAVAVRPVGGAGSGGVPWWRWRRWTRTPVPLALMAETR